MKGQGCVLMRVLFITLFLFGFLFGCSDVKKIEAENNSLKLDIIKQKTKIQELEALIEKLNSDILEIKQEKLAAVNVVNKEKAELEEKILTLKSDEGSIFKKIMDLFEDKKDRGSLEDYLYIEKEGTIFLKMFPDSEHVGAIKDMLADIEKRKVNSKEITDAEKKIYEAVEKRNYNEAYGELEKITPLISKQRHARHVAFIATAKDNPIILKDMEDFWDKASTGMWVGQKYALYALWDTKGRKICDAKIDGDRCGEEGVEVKFDFDSGGNSYLKYKGSKSCIKFIFRRKTIYVYSVSSGVCS